MGYWAGIGLNYIQACWLDPVTNIGHDNYKSIKLHGFSYSIISLQVYLLMITEAMHLVTPIVDIQTMLQVPPINC